MTQHIFIVLVDNGDTEPEIWAFASEDKADAFAEARAGESLSGTMVQSLPILSDEEADEVIEHESNF